MTKLATQTNQIPAQRIAQMTMAASQQTTSSTSNRTSQSGWSTTDTYAPSTNTHRMFNQSSAGWMNAVSTVSSNSGQGVLDSQGIGHSGNGSGFSLSDAAAACLGGVERGYKIGKWAGGAVGGLGAGPVGAAAGYQWGGSAGAAIGCPVAIGIAYALSAEESSDEPSECQETPEDTNSSSTTETNSTKNEPDNGAAANPNDDRVCGDVENHPLRADNPEQVINRQNLDGRSLTNDDQNHYHGESASPTNLESNTGHDRGNFIDTPCTANPSGDQVVIKPQKQFFLADPIDAGVSR